MSTSGQKPTPRNLRLIQGVTPGRMNDQEPEVEVAVPNVPRFLKGHERRCFRSTAIKLAKMRVMTEADVDALTMYAVNFVRWKEATDTIRKAGMIIKSPKNYPIQNPYLAIANKAQKVCLDILCEFGLTPSSRTRVKKE